MTSPLFYLEKDFFALQAAKVEKTWPLDEKDVPNSIPLQNRSEKHRIGSLRNQQVCPPTQYACIVNGTKFRPFALIIRAWRQFKGLSPKPPQREHRALQETWIHKEHFFFA